MIVSYGHKRVIRSMTVMMTCSWLLVLDLLDYHGLLRQHATTHAFAHAVPWL